MLMFLAVGAVSAQTGNPISSAFVSPNPVEGRAELVFDEPLGENVNIVVKDLTGKTVYFLRPEIALGDCAHIPLDIESLRKGIYILQITGTSGKVKTLKFQKT